MKNVSRRISDERAVVVDLVKLKDRAARLGLWKTFHLLDEASKAIGWEIAKGAHDGA